MGAADIGRGATEAGLDPAKVVRSVDRSEARDRLLELLRPGDVVLVKASRGVALDVLVDELVAALEPGP